MEESGMNKKQILRFIAIILTAVFAVGLLAGCGSQGANKGDGNKQGSFSENGKKAKGRYVEQEIELNLKEDEKGISLINKKEGGLRLYTYISGEKKYCAYDSTDGKDFTPIDTQWLNNVVGGTDCYMKSIFQGEDGIDYALFYKDEENHLISSKDSGSQPELFPDVINKNTGIEMAKILENGYLVTNSGTEGKLEVWDSDQNNINSFVQGQTDTTGLKVFDSRGNNAVALNKNKDGFSIFNIQTGKVEQDIAYDGFSGGSYGILKLGSAGDCFYLDRNGLHHFNKGGTVIETLIEGDISSMGDSTMDIIDFAFGENSDYFVLYNSEGKCSLIYYVYDEEAKVVPDNQLVIFGLEENKTIKQAVSRFQKEHPEVRVNYKTGNWRENGTTKSDQIRVLNTELLGGNGADILVLDGLPLDSYIEKGVLMDLTEIYNEFQNESPVSENIVTGMKRDKALYQLPVRIKSLSIFGTDEEVAAMQSLDSLKTYLGNGNGGELLGEKSYEYYLRLLLTLNYKEFFPEGKREAIPEKELKKLLETTKQLAEQSGATAFTIKDYYLGKMPDLTDETLIQEMGGTDFLSSVNSNNELRVRKGKGAVINEAGGSYSLMEACEVLKELNVNPQGVSGLYIPKGIVGVNNSSKNKELAKEFLKLLFSEEIQSLDLNDGFPVNVNAQESWSKKEAPDDGVGISVSGSDGDGEIFSAMEPDGKQLVPFIELCRSADTPVMMDDVILEVILDEGISFSKGEKTVEQAVLAITSKTKTYLAE